MHLNFCCWATCNGHQRYMYPTFPCLHSLQLQAQTQKTRRSLIRRACSKLFWKNCTLKLPVLKTTTLKTFFESGVRAQRLPSPSIYVLHTKLCSCCNGVFCVADNYSIPEPRAVRRWTQGDGGLDGGHPECRQPRLLRREYSFSFSWRISHRKHAESEMRCFHRHQRQQVEFPILRKKECMTSLHFLPGV